MYRWVSWDHENYTFAQIKVTKMGSIIGHRIDYNGAGALRGQRHIPSKNWPKYLPSFPGATFHPPKRELFNNLFQCVIQF